ncbi:DUF4123 domain-containing protein [Oceanicola sp. D3]|uniref:DUF4123 domain-containing protein n=1 Tax=Oceanicola sp. D3 TaxID=2587163 RepID=UPI001AEF537E|nr:DUF4123 domain-containing protein [Oceanicola sp. D3]
MSEAAAPAPWLGHCHFVTTSGVPAQGLVAVYCTDAEGFRTALDAAAPLQGLTVKGTDKLIPADQLQPGDFGEWDPGSLAESVGAARPVAFGELTASDGEGTGDDALLELQDFGEIEPLSMMMDEDPPPTVPKALKAALFGPMHPPSDAEVARHGSAAKVPAARTFAILDAAKVPMMQLYLEQSGLPHRCLYKGEALERFGDVAPWVVELEEEATFTRRLFSRSKLPADLWDKAPGMLLRGRAELEDVWKHFRKFTKVGTHDGKSLFLRFWEPSVLRALPHILVAENAARFFPDWAQLIWVDPAEGRAGGIRRV